VTGDKFEIQMSKPEGNPQTAIRNLALLTPDFWLSRAGAK